MDQDFIAELDLALSNIGSDTVWKRTIGGVELWISPLQLLGQEKVAETITKMDLGANIVNESKRMTLAHAIVGISEHDLRDYRNGSAIFPITGKDGKPVKTTLDKYLYHKLGSWGAEFINDVFIVYADLMETFQKNNLKDIKFDNAKDPREELAEVQARTYELRQQLMMPPLVEGTEPADEEISEREGFAKPEEEPEEESPVSFDPFAVIPQQERSQIPVQSPIIQPETKVFVPVDPPVPSGAAAQRARDAAAIEGSFSQPMSAMAAPVPAPVAQVAAPIRQDVVDRPSSREPVEAPVIDRTNVSRNPRFRAPMR